LRCEIEMLRWFDWVQRRPSCSHVSANRKRMSADIRGLFCATCDQLGLRWTQSNHRNISISHRHSVALLEVHVGPKA